MLNKRFPNVLFQTFFVSRDTSNCPLIGDVLKFCKKLDELKLFNDGGGSISLRYGKRILINGEDVDLSSMRQDDIIEIVDYDPSKNIVLAIGKKDPCIETPVHWLIQRARDDINTVFMLNNKIFPKKFSRQFPSTDDKSIPGSIDLAKQILKALRNNKVILIKNRGILFAEFNLNLMEKSILNILG